MKRLQIFVLAGIFLLCVGTFNAAYCNTDKVNSENSDVGGQSDDEMYSHESVLQDDLDSEYAEPKTDDVITNDDEETEENDDDDQQTDTIEEGEEV